ncbi:Superfamily I DNA and/or RNA helicase [Chitinophaga rupis]|uniref:Superfamily I DNA and/or RNA helicase n=1 Tax=Chitinophaga rupis TaxID=573321 RepID=A0A1H8GJ80_9BACT|nr:ATP-binding protein [Chitinophaga rupis]SEN44062.1 Superfamily I DNA and/or RNA helicase [Chitinophaga rupis]
MKKQKNILSFWKDIEIFSLPDVPRDAKILDFNKPLPWELPYVPEANSNLRHFIFLGKHSKEHIVKLIEEQAGYEPDGDFKEKPTGDTCMATLILDEQGCLVAENPYLQASYIHGLKCLQDGVSLSTLNDRLSEVQDQFTERHPINPDAENLEKSLSPVITTAHLMKEIEVLNKLGIKGMPCEEQVYVQSIRVSKRAKNDIPFLNSFYLDDLQQLLNTKETFGKGLRQYLTEEVSEKPKVDFLKDVNAVFEALNPAQLPAGRWPSNPLFSLYTAQLGAVSTCLSELADSGILGVNGPPGTGKTTLLSDVVAEIIVQRAQQLMQVGVTGLFNKGTKLEMDDRFAYYFLTKSKIFDDVGIVVASNNNSAVENISKELPDERKIDRNTFTDASYFTDHSQQLIDGKSWGALAAALGNAENRTNFKGRFWYKNEKTSGFQEFLKSIYSNTEGEDRTPEYQDLFDNTKAELHVLLKEFGDFKKDASDFYQMIPAYFEDRELAAEIKGKIQIVIEHLQSIHTDTQSLLQKITVIEKDISQVQHRIQLHQSVKPRFFFFKKLFNTAGFKRWNNPFLSLLAEYNNLSDERGVFRKKLDELETKIDAKEKDKRSLEQQLATIIQRITNYNDRRRNLHEFYGIDYRNIPDEHLLEALQSDKKEFHKSNPWSSAGINKLRSEIFLKSLKLHEYAVLSNAKQFRNNIGLLIDLMDGKAEVSDRIALSLWQSFFFCIPVISTTLASVSRLFRSLGKESIGWVLLDEAGQATPQSVAGIIYRAKRTVIIGDPLQIEPVVTIPGTLIKILNATYKNDLVWSPLRSSAQVLADRVTAIGSWMDQGGDEPIWTGFPLRTHRRCNSPMFDISNEIAYSGQMVKAIDDVPFDCALGNSQWFDITGSTINKKHIVKEEIDLLKEKIQLLGKPGDSIFVISPFKTVAVACIEAISKINSNVQCGTIHTFQGKEADIVFLVLGSDPGNNGSRAWASKTPNMLNVAVTRARRKFYVIGSKKHWKTHKYFKVLSSSL